MYISLPEFMFHSNLATKPNDDWTFRAAKVEGPIKSWGRFVPLERGRSTSLLDPPHLYRYLFPISRKNAHPPHSALRPRLHQSPYLLSFGGEDEYYAILHCIHHDGSGCCTPRQTGFFVHFTTTKKNNNSCCSVVKTAHDVIRDSNTTRSSHIH